MWWRTPIGLGLVGLGIVSVAAAYQQALGLFFNVTGPSGSVHCGSPFLGRYIGSSGDPMAEDYECLVRASGHRDITFILGALGIILVLAAMVAARPRPRQTTADIMRIESRGETVSRIANGIGVVTALLAGLLLVGAGLAFGAGSIQS